MLYYFKTSLKYIYQALDSSSGTKTFTLTGLSNPDNYQSTTYGTPSVAMKLYHQYNLARTFSGSQANFNTFTARNMLFSIQTNSPSFDTDRY